MVGNVVSILKIVTYVTLTIESIIHLELAVVPEDFPCFVCGEKKIFATMLLCDQC